MTWDEYFMSLVYLVSMKSRDPSTKIGAVIVAPDNRILATGYNGLPRGSEYRSEKMERPEKYMWMCHGEENAILQCDHRPVGCRMYTNGIPCSRCGRMTVQSGIVEVITDSFWDDLTSKEPDRKWAEEARRTLSMFREANPVPVRHRAIQIDLPMISRFYRGREIRG